MIHVLIIGPHMPRENLGAESLWEKPKVLDLLGTHLLDGSVGEAFYGVIQVLPGKFRKFDLAKTSNLSGDRT